MANRIVGNVYIIDSGSLAPIPFSSGTKIASVIFWSSDSTGTLRLATENTANVIMHLSNPINVPNTIGAYIGGCYATNSLTVPTLTAGTAWIYFL